MAKYFQMSTTWGDSSFYDVCFNNKCFFVGTTLIGDEKPNIGDYIYTHSNNNKHIWKITKVYNNEAFGYFENEKNKLYNDFVEWHKNNTGCSKEWLHNEWKCIAFDVEEISVNKEININTPPNAFSACDDLKKFIKLNK